MTRDIDSDDPARGEGYDEEYPSRIPANQPGIAVVPPAERPSIVRGPSRTTTADTVAVVLTILIFYWRNAVDGGRLRMAEARVYGEVGDLSHAAVAVDPGLDLEGRIDGLYRPALMVISTASGCPCGWRWKCRLLVVIDYYDTVVDAWKSLFLKPWTTLPGQDTSKKE